MLLDKKNELSNRQKELTQTGLGDFGLIKETIKRYLKRWGFRIEKLRIKNGFRNS